MYLQIPVTVVILANTEITIQGAIIRQIRHAYKSTGSDGAVAAANVVLVVDDKADGDATCERRLIRFKPQRCYY